MVYDSVIDSEIDEWGESVNINKITKAYNSRGDEYQSSASTSTVTVVVNDINGDEEFNVEGRYKPGDKTFFAKSSNTDVEVGDNVIHLGNKYHIRDVIRHRLSGENQVVEIRTSKTE